jgi:hypothetical protein
MNFLLSNTFWIKLIIIALAIAPAFALGEGNRNLLLIGVMSLSPLVILRNFEFDKMDLLLLLFLVTIIAFPLVVNPETMRWSTVMYSVMFGLTFIAFKQLLRKKYFTIINYLNILKYLIYAYFLVLLVQQFCVLMDLPIFNVNNYDTSIPWKLNSFAAESSHSARIVALLMYSYISVKELVKKRKYNFRLEIKKDKWVWLGFLWTMVTMGSGTAFIFIPIVLLKFVRIKNVLPILIIFGAIYIMVEQIGNNAFQRAFNTVIVTISLDEATIMEADHSASMRIVPLLILAKKVDLNSFNGWFGHGIDYTSTFLSGLIYGVPEGFSGGGLFQLWMEYGFISFALFLIFSFSTSFKKGDYLSVIFWFLLVFMYGVNNQIVWLSIFLLFINKYFYKLYNIGIYTNKIKIK